MLAACVFFVSIYILDRTRHGSGDLLHVRVVGLAWPAEIADDLPLAPAAHLPVAVEGRQDALVAKVLAPGFELLGGGRTIAMN
jgi:hypothetical protein